MVYEQPLKIDQIPKAALYDGAINNAKVTRGSSDKESAEEYLEHFVVRVKFMLKLKSDKEAADKIREMLNSRKWK